MPDYTIQLVIDLPNRRTTPLKRAFLLLDGYLTARDTKALPFPHPQNHQLLSCVQQLFPFPLAQF